jgi:hypothetical protein
VDAAGSAMGSLGLLVFAVIIWQFLPGPSTWAVLSAATVAWAVVSIAVQTRSNRALKDASKLWGRSCLMPMAKRQRSGVFSGQRKAQSVCNHLTICRFQGVLTSYRGFPDVPHP